MLLKLILFVLIHAYHFKDLNTKKPTECAKYKSLWFSYMYPYTEALNKLSSPKTFNNACPTSICCDGSMHNDIVAVSHLKLKSVAESHLQVISEELTNTSTIINEYLISNIENSKKMLNQMFTNTYTNSYKMHQSFFFDFYEKLKKYVEGKNDNLQVILDNFFVDMAERIVAMMVIAKKDPDTIRCLTNNLMKLDPYQGADKAITTAVMGAYPVSRMFLNALMASNDVFIDLIKDKTTPSWDCAILYAKTFYCSLCAASKVKPCDSLCKWTIGQCLGSFNNKEISKVSKTWSKLVVSMENISRKLINPFNFPEVNKNLHVKISDAIMNVHNFFPNVREKIWANCKIQGSRKRRSTDWNNQFPSTFNNAESQSSLPDAGLTPLVKAFSIKLPDMKVHLKKFRNIICSSKKSSIIETNDQCWNGTSASTGLSVEPKQKKNNKNLSIDPVTSKSVRKLLDITTVLNKLLTGENKDPKAFKIEFIPKPKKAVTRQADENIPIIEGSGEVLNNVTPEKKSKVEPSQSNEELVEGSGSENVPDITENITTQGPPSFPNLENPIVTTKPDQPVKKPVITDDEDLIDSPNENTKSEPPKIPVEGSGQVENKPNLPELPRITTTTAAAILTEEPPPKAPMIDNKPIESSGFNESPDDETNKTPLMVYPHFPDISPKSNPSTTLAPQLTTLTNLIPQELPGEIPQEIWIPRAMDYDSYGRLVSVTTKTATSIQMNGVVLVLHIVAALLGKYLLIV